MSEYPPNLNYFQFLSAYLSQTKKASKLEISNAWRKYKEDNNKKNVATTITSVGLGTLPADILRQIAMISPIVSATLRILCRSIRSVIRDVSSSIICQVPISIMEIRKYMEKRLETNNRFKKAIKYKRLLCTCIQHIGNKSELHEMYYTETSFLRSVHPPTSFLTPQQWTSVTDIRFDCCRMATCSVMSAKDVIDQALAHFVMMSENHTVTLGEEEVKTILLTRGCEPYHVKQYLPTNI